MQTGDRPDPYGIVGGLLFFAFAALTPARARRRREHRHRAGAGGPFFALFGAYQRTVRGAAAKELNVAVASVSASTCVLPSSAAYMLCSSG